MADDQGEPRGIGLGYIIYQQVASVLGAFGLIAFLGHFVQVDWRGALADLIAVWAEYVRPAVKHLLDLTVVAFCHWLGWTSFQVPLAIRDYLTVGLVLTASVLRAWAPNVGFDLRSILMVSQLALLMTVGWPLPLLFLVVTALSRVKEDSGLRRISWLSLSPLIYLALLLAANYLLLKPGT